MSRLAINEAANAIRIGWYFPEDGDFGAHLGESQDLVDKKPEGHEEAESWIATQAILRVFPDASRDYYGFNFESFSQAKRALTAANAALKVHSSEKPWPEWAKLALENGWKAPKGWKP